MWRQKQKAQEGGEEPQEGRRQGSQHKDTQVLVVHQNHQTRMNIEFRGNSTWTLDGQTVLPPRPNTPTTALTEALSTSLRVM